MPTSIDSIIRAEDQAALIANAQDNRAAIEAAASQLTATRVVKANNINAEVADNAATNAVLQERDTNTKAELSNAIVDQVNLSQEAEIFLQNATNQANTQENAIQTTEADAVLVAEKKQANDTFFTQEANKSNAQSELTDAVVNESISDNKRTRKNAANIIAENAFNIQIAINQAVRRQKAIAPTAVIDKVELSDAAKAVVRGEPTNTTITESKLAVPTAGVAANGRTPVIDVGEAQRGITREINTLSSLDNDDTEAEVVALALEEEVTFREEIVEEIVAEDIEAARQEGLELIEDK